MKDVGQLLTLLSVTLPWKARLLRETAAAGFPRPGSGRIGGSETGSGGLPKSFSGPGTALSLP